MTLTEAITAMEQRSIVAAGKPGTEDYDTGLIAGILPDEMASVAWQSGVTTPCPLADLIGEFAEPASVPPARKFWRVTVRQEAWIYWRGYTDAESAEEACALGLAAWEGKADLPVPLESDGEEAGGFDHAECAAEDDDAEEITTDEFAEAVAEHEAALAEFEAPALVPAAGSPEWYALADVLSYAESFVEDWAEDAEPGDPAFAKATEALARAKALVNGRSVPAFTSEAARQRAGELGRAAVAADDPVGKFVGFQLANAAGANIQGDEGDPASLASFEVMSPDEAVRIIAALPPGAFLLMPIFEGQIEEPRVLPDEPAPDPADYLTALRAQARAIDAALLDAATAADAERQAWAFIRVIARA